MSRSKGITRSLTDWKRPLLTGSRTTKFAKQSFKLMPLGAKRMAHHASKSNLNAADWRFLVEELHAYVTKQNYRLKPRAASCTRQTAIMTNRLRPIFSIARLSQMLLIQFGYRTLLT
jgi:hypothetical protein